MVILAGQGLLEGFNYTFSGQGIPRLIIARQPGQSSYLQSLVLGLADGTLSSGDKHSLDKAENIVRQVVANAYFNMQLSLDREWYNQLAKLLGINSPDALMNAAEESRNLSYKEIGSSFLTPARETLFGLKLKKSYYDGTVVLEFPNSGIFGFLSENHCELGLANDSYGKEAGLWVNDLEAENGTFVMQPMAQIFEDFSSKGFNPVWARYGSVISLAPRKIEGLEFLVQRD